MRNAKMPFVDEGHCITKAQQAFVSIHGGIPCNLAPAHFTVHVVQVRLSFALGFAVEANLHEIFLCLLRLYVFVWLTLSGG